MKAFITTYALTDGIKEVEARLSNNSPDMIIFGEGLNQRYSRGEGKEWHRTMEQAVAKAEMMKLRKIASLKKQIENVSKIQFK